MSKFELKDRTKPLGGKAYGSIPHLPGSRRGPGDCGLSDELASILTTRTRDQKDVVIVEEKLDGVCVSAAKIDGKIVALTRYGYLATGGDYDPHHMWAKFVEDFNERFDELLFDGERVVGEWCVMAHGTQYSLPHLPFVAFDIFRDGKRVSWDERTARVYEVELPQPDVLHHGGAWSVEAAVAKLSEGSAHGAHHFTGAEGAVWRVEREGEFDFLGKYVRPDYKNGRHLSSNTDHPDVWNHWKGWSYWETIRTGWDAIEL